MLHGNHANPEATASSASLRQETQWGEPFANIQWRLWCSKASMICVSKTLPNLLLDATGRGATHGMGHKADFDNEVELTTEVVN